MKKVFSVVLSASVFLFCHGVWAHCPIPFVDNSADYCMGLEWQKGDQKVKGNLQPVDQLTPFLNREGEIPQKWIYSKVLIKVWKKGDTTHVPVILPNLHIFPYMVMVDGMHHEATYSFVYNTELAGYVLSGFSMQEMQGCWSLRGTTTSATDDIPSSVLLANVGDYQNLSTDENLTAQNYCAQVSSAPVVDDDMGGMDMSQMGEHHH